jgi:hypothetical protein
MPTAAANRRRVRNILARDPNWGRKSDAERETDRRIAEMNRKLYPMPWDDAEREADALDDQDVGVRVLTDGNETR